MFNHEPDNYRCPFCAVVNGEEGDFPYTKQADIVYRDADLTALIASHWWPNNLGHIIIIPNQHIENLYDLSDSLGAKIVTLSKRVAVALKETYQCDGVSTRQHNEPAGDQDVWHYHLHVFPRYENDNLYTTHDQKRKSEPEERIPYAEKLRNYFESN